MNSLMDSGVGSFPRTSVAYAPTKSFATAFPKEVAVQQEKFTQPTWANRIAETPKDKEEVDTPVAVENPKVEVRKVAEQVAESMPIVPLLLGVAIFLGVYITVRYAKEWLTSGATSMPQ